MPDPSRLLAATAPADVIGSFVVLVWFCSLALAYLMWSARRGAARYERVDKQGRSLIRVKALVLAYYWSLQGPARWLARARVSANQLSWFSLIAGATSGVAFGFGLFGVAGAAFLISTICDSLDGLVARLDGSSSDAGEVLDASIDRYVDYIVFGGLAIYYRWSPPLEALVIAALAAASMVTYSSAKAEALGVEVRSALMRRHDRSMLMITGAALAGFSVAYWEGRVAGMPSLGFPMLAALALLAGLGNFAAVRRLTSIAAAVRRRSTSAAGPGTALGGGAAGEVESPGVGLVVGHGAAEVEGSGQSLGLDR